ncbi:hypothetical protein [Vulcanisaeta thermophila]|uniref:hypothetical protein n=1 Tax=Vulcanisaeta thermophila TaxID=867917 RepID=UPI000853D6FF|nr:hypothetical protein [Vulcanisaeta thermophila]
MEELKELLRRLLREDREFLRDIILGAISGDGSIAEEIVKLILSSPKARAELLSEIASGLAIPLNLATKDDIKRVEDRITTVESRLSTVEKELSDVKNRLANVENRLSIVENRLANVESKLSNVENRLTSVEGRLSIVENKLSIIENRVTNIENRITNVENRVTSIENRMATKEQIENITMTIEEESREAVGWLLRQRGIQCSPERLFLDHDYEFDVYCVAGDLTIIGEAKVRVGVSIVDRFVSKVDEAMRRWPDRFRGRVVRVLYCFYAYPDAVDRARELGIWLIESFREKTPMP